MCGNIRTLFNFEPPATEDEIRASALQFVCKLSAFNKPPQIAIRGPHRATLATVLNGQIIFYYE